jgi:hypothetical protein
VAYRYQSGLKASIKSASNRQSNCVQVTDSNVRQLSEIRGACAAQKAEEKRFGRQKGTLRIRTRWECMRPYEKRACAIKGSSLREATLAYRVFDFVRKCESNSEVGEKLGLSHNVSSKKKSRKLRLRLSSKELMDT